MTDIPDIRRIYRTTAEELLAGVVKRAQEINADPKYAWGIRQIWVFGSYLRPEVERLGDLDIAFELSQRENFDELWKARKSARTTRPRNLADEVGWPQKEIVRHLKNGKRSISLHRVDEVLLLGCPYRVVYQDA